MQSGNQEQSTLLLPKEFKDDVASVAPSSDTVRVSQSMKEWLEQESRTFEEQDAMSMVQLEHRFQGQPFQWQTYEKLGFKHNKNNMTYEAPSLPSREDPLSSSSTRVFTSKELEAYLDQFAIPEIVSTLQDLPMELNLSKEEEAWGRKIRDEAVFLSQRNKLSINNRGEMFMARGDGDTVPMATGHNKLGKRQKSVGRERNSITSSDPGAEVFFKKFTKSRNKKRTSLDLDEAEAADDPVVFPTIEECFEQTKSCSTEFLDRVHASYQAKFLEWRFLISANQSLLLYGVGSKVEILNQFADMELQKDGNIIAIDGFNKDVTIEGLLDLLVDHWLERMEPTRSVREFHTPYGACRCPRVGINFPRSGEAAVIHRAIAIAHALARRASQTLRPFYLVIHNIDGAGLRNPTAQEALAGLVLNSLLSNGMNCLRIVASVDHVNGPTLLWDSLTCASFRWIWTKVDTYRPYGEEIVESAIAGVQSKGAKRRKAMESSTEASIFAVLTSLAPRHTEVLKVLAELQLIAIARGADNEWVNYIDLKGQCNHKCVVSQEQQLRSFLKELIDQGMVERRGMGSSQMYRIPYASEKLKEILEYKKRNGDEES